MRFDFRKAAVLLLGAAVLTAALVTPASADPSGPTSIAILSPDTMKYLDNDLANDYNGANPGGPTVGSWGGTNPITGGTHDWITIKSGQPSIQRPNTCAEAITALENISYLDMVGCARGPRTGDVDPVTGLPLLFVRAAQHTVQYALSGTATTHGSKNLSASQLAQIYTTPNITWNQVDPSNPSTAVIQAMIPQAGYDMRTVFLDSIGVTEAQLRTDPNLITVGGNDYTPIQNNADAIAPFSVAWYKTKVPAGAIVLDTVPGGYSAVTFAYHVVRNAGTASAPAIPASLQPFLSSVCGTAAQNIITTDGFTAINSCGGIDHI